MKIIGVMNGWTEAPHQRWRYILLPFGWQRTPAWVSVSLFGFVFFIAR